MRIIVSILFLFLAIASASHAAPNLNNCQLIGQVCLEADTTHIVDGFPIHAACWEWKDTYDCDRQNPQNQCAALEAQSARVQIGGTGCRKTLQTCNDERDGFCHQYTDRWICTGSYTQEGNGAVSTYRPWQAVINAQPSIHIWRKRNIIVSETPSRNATPNTSACPQAARATCQASTLHCTSPRATHSIGGLGITRDCWQWAQDYTCRSDSINLNDCTEFDQDASCSRQGDECIAYDGDGNCTHRTYHYQCGIDAPSSVTQNCGSQSWCLNGVCNDVQRGNPNQGFGKAAAAMNLLQEMANDFDTEGQDVTVFSGKKAVCKKWVFGLKNCCKTGGILVSAGLAECSESEKKLSVARGAGQTHHLRNYCSRKAFWGSCLVRASAFCQFNNRLAKIVHQQGRPQLGIGWSNCDGLTPEQLAGLDWSQIDLSEAIGDIHQRMTIPEANALKAQVQRRIEDFYEHNKPATPADADEEDDDDSNS